ncbi:MAG: hypothetical protein U5K72_04060 [Balneolaceae bacterium]|nr:hypothetical protein [Balneolaceae bacterium]
MDPIRGYCPANKPNVGKSVRRVKVGDLEGEAAHQMDWVRACKESPQNRTEAKSSFDKSGPFNEMVVMGVLAVRLQELDKELEWDGESMEFTNINPNEYLRIIKRDGFNIEDGNPTFSREYTDQINAQQFANGLIRKEYRDGWDLPNMPA